MDGRAATEPPRGADIAAAPLRLRYGFEAGSGVCLWAADAATCAALGDEAITPERLPLSRNTCCWLAHLVAWFDTWLDWDAPPQRAPHWSQAEAARFSQAADVGLARLRAELPAAGFTLIDSRTPPP